MLAWLAHKYVTRVDAFDLFLLLLPPCAQIDINPNIPPPQQPAAPPLPQRTAPPSGAGGAVVGVPLGQHQQEATPPLPPPKQV